MLLFVYFCVVSGKTTWLKFGKYPVWFGQAHVTWKTNTELEFCSHF